MKKNFQFSIFNFQNGFTMLEILIVIALSGVLITIVTLSFSKLNSNQALSKSVDLAVSVLNEAHSLTLSSKNSSQYGVKLEPSQIILFQGSVYMAGDPNNTPNQFNSLVSIRNISLSGGATSVVFKRLTGETDQAGTFEIYLKSEPATFRTVTVVGTGLIETD